MRRVSDEHVLLGGAERYEQLRRWGMPDIPAAIASGARLRDIRPSASGVICALGWLLSHEEVIEYLPG